MELIIFGGFQYLVEYFIKRFEVQQIAAVKVNFFLGYHLDSLKTWRVPIGTGNRVCKIINSHHFVTSVEQLDYSVASDVARTSRHKNLFPVRHFAVNQKINV